MRLKGSHRSRLGRKPSGQGMGTEALAAVGDRAPGGKQDVPGVGWGRLTGKGCNAEWVVEVKAGHSSAQQVRMESVWGRGGLYASGFVDSVNV